MQNVGPWLNLLTSNGATCAGRLRASRVVFTALLTSVTDCVAYMARLLFRGQGHIHQQHHVHPLQRCPVQDYREHPKPWIRVGRIAVGQLHSLCAGAPQHG